jgi:uncharacterized protein (DUF1330 family)
MKRKDMAIYLVTSCDITDPEKYAPYVPNVLPLLEKYGAEIIAADKNAITIDGEKRDVTVILKFQSQDDVTKLFEDPEYKPWLDIRLASTTNRATIMLGEFDPATF